MADQDPNMNSVIGGWALGNILILIQILTGYSVVLYFFGFLLYSVTLLYMILYSILISDFQGTVVYGFLCATMSAMCWFFIAVQENEAYQGWVTFFGVMTGVGGLLIIVGVIVGVWRNRETVKEKVQKGVNFVKKKTLRKSENVQELKF